MSLNIVSLSFMYLGKVKASTYDNLSVSCYVIKPEWEKKSYKMLAKASNGLFGDASTPNQDSYSQNWPKKILSTIYIKLKKV
jgi:hypothetical protein